MAELKCTGISSSKKLDKDDVEQEEWKATFKGEGIKLILSYPDEPEHYLEEPVEIKVTKVQTKLKDHEPEPDGKEGKK